MSKQGSSCRLSISADRIFSDLKIGDSVAVNGICLTATSIKGSIFTVDVMHETLNRTSLSSLKAGAEVNLERAMAANGRFGGHIVSGHIDGTGRVAAFTNDGIAVWLRVEADAPVLKYIVEKGSVALDGVSLTVAKVDTKSFSVSLIPHTAAETTLLSKKIGDKINIECDIIGKYVEKLLNFKETEGITEELLLRNGFI